MLSCDSWEPTYTHTPSDSVRICAKRLKTTCNFMMENISIPFTDDDDFWLNEA
jgi:hypothetical protein